MSTLLDLYEDITIEKEIINGITFIGVVHMNFCNVKNMKNKMRYDFIKKELKDYFNNVDTKITLVCEENLDSWLEYEMKCKLPLQTYSIMDHNICDEDDFNQCNRRSHYMIGDVKGLQKNGYKNIVVLVGYRHLQDIINIYKSGSIYENEYRKGYERKCILKEFVKSIIDRIYIP